MSTTPKELRSPPGTYWIVGLRAAPHEGFAQWLCEPAEHHIPQWYCRWAAKHCASVDEARAFRKRVLRGWTPWPGCEVRVVRVLPPGTRLAWERARADAAERERDEARADVARLREALERLHEAIERTDPGQLGDLKCEADAIVGAALAKGGE